MPDDWLVNELKRRGESFHARRIERWQEKSVQIRTFLNKNARAIEKRLGNCPDVEIGDFVTELEIGA